MQIMIDWPSRIIKNVHLVIFFPRILKTTKFFIVRVYKKIKLCRVKNHKGKFGGLVNYIYRPYKALKTLNFQNWCSVDTLHSETS